MNTNRLSAVTCPKLATACCAVSMILAGGCGPVDEFAPFKGTLRIDGTAAANILVVFTPESDGSRALARSAAVTDAQGHFRLRTDDGRQGALVARHQVTLEDMDRYTIERTDKPPSATERLPDSRVPRQYAAAATTPLRVSVPSGGDSVELEVPATRR